MRTRSICVFNSSMKRQARRRPAASASVLLKQFIPAQKLDRIRLGKRLHGKLLAQLPDQVGRGMTCQKLDDIGLDGLAHETGIQHFCTGDLAHDGSALRPDFKKPHL